MNGLLAVVVCSLCVLAVSSQSYPHNGENEHFYRYGPNHGDTPLRRADDSSSNQIHLSTRFVFFDGTYNSAWVNHNGIITTGGPFYSYTTSAFPLSTGNPGISPYWTDVNIADSDNVNDAAIYYRQDTSTPILNRATAEVLSVYRDEVPDFAATWTLVATWHRVTFYGNNGQADPTPTITFQCIMVSDGTHSFALYHYGQMDWTTGTVGRGSAVTGLGGTAAQVGFDAGDGTNFYNMHGSQTGHIRAAVEGNSFAYRVDRAAIEDARSPVDTRCTVGTFSETGYEPCEQCSTGSYANADGSTSCTDCEEGETTLTRGSSSEFDCYAPGHGVFDPHFMITDPVSKEHLCFDYTGENSESMDLISDNVSGISVTGKLFAPNPEDEDITYFSDIEVKSRTSLVTFSRSFISVNGEKVLWTDSEVYISDDVVIRPVTERAETMMIELADGDVSVIVNRHEGEVAGQYLGIYAAHVDGLSEETLGVIGQFIHSGFEINDNNGDVIATVALQRGDVSVPVTSTLRFSPTAHGKLACWLYTPSRDSENALLVEHEERLMIAGAV